MQICKRCGIDQPKENFVTIDSMCNNCKQEAKLKARAKYRDRALINSRKWHKENKDRKNAEIKKRYHEDEEFRKKKLVACKKYQNTHKELCLEKHNKYRKENKDYFNLKNREAYKIKRENEEWMENQRAVNRRSYAKNIEKRRKDAREYGYSNRDKINNRRLKRYEDDPEKYKKHKEVRNKSVAMWRKANPVKRKVHSKVEKAIQTGKLKKPNRCQVCGGEFESKNIIAHHFDYESPLEVLWCCRTCHGVVHRIINQREKAGDIMQVKKKLATN